MRLPSKSADMEQAKEKLHLRYADMEKRLLHEVDELANSGFAAKRWAERARTHFEEGVMALHRALRDFPADDPNQYGKVPEVSPYPTPPPTDTESNISAKRQIAARPERSVDWKDLPGFKID